MKNHQIYYETMYILRPDIAEEEVSDHIEKYNKILKKNGGKILDSQMRGKRRLAYQIGKHREGIYVQLSHQGDGQHIAKIEKAMRLSEDVIRYMTVKQDGPLPTPKPSNKTTKTAGGENGNDKEIKEVSKSDKDEIKKSSKDEDVQPKDKTEVKTEDKKEIKAEDKKEIKAEDKKEIKAE